jgi:hypothetical protein
MIKKVYPDQKKRFLTVLAVILLFMLTAVIIHILALQKRSTNLRNQVFGISTSAKEEKNRK